MRATCRSPLRFGTVAEAIVFAQDSFKRRWGGWLEARFHVDKLGYVGEGGTRIVHAFS